MNRILFLALILVPSVLLGQQPPVAAPDPNQKPKDVKIESVTVESAPLPGTTAPWAKLVTKFRSTPKWADGIAFNYTALLGVPGQYRVVNGIVRYANVKAGNTRAVMYISPNTAERFGAPIAVNVRAIYRDEVVDEFTFRGPGQIPANWDRQFDRISGALLNVLQTPWMMTEYVTSPDVLVAQ